MRELVGARSGFRRKLKASGLLSTGNLDASSEPPHRPTTGPIPSEWQGQVVRTTAGPADTYLIRFGRRDVWKVGHAKNVDVRLRNINRHVPYEVLGERWQLHRSQTWPNSVVAYQMEQAFFQAMEASRSSGERLVCEPSHIERLWNVLIG